MNDTNPLFLLDSYITLTFQLGRSLLPGDGVRRLRDDLGVPGGRVPAAAAVQAGHRLHRARRRIPRQPRTRHTGGHTSFVCSLVRVCQFGHVMYMMYLKILLPGIILFDHIESNRFRAQPEVSDHVGR